MAVTDVPHYTVGDIETIDYIYDKLGADGGLQYVLGNILKYASRAEHKGQLRSDLIKIGHYAELALERLPDDVPGIPKFVARRRGPRVFVDGIDIPGDVTVVRDKDGDIWAWGEDAETEYPDAELGKPMEASFYAPFTEVL